jgi:hypothetical protein
MSQLLETQRAATVRPAAAEVRAPLTFITRSDTKPVFYSAAYTGDAPRVLCPAWLA